MSRYPKATWIPWKTPASNGKPTYYTGNTPKAVVLHRTQGWVSTAINWANNAYYGASWHYTVSLDGNVYQHLEHNQGGYHAGIPDTAKTPTWSLWEGHSKNVNLYTIGVECEGMAGSAWPDAQLAALKELCEWLSKDLNIPLDYAHFPPHADIDVVNRVNDFDTPARRSSIVYPYIFKEEDMADPRFDILNEALQKRMAIETLANNPDLPTVEKAYALLKKEGLVK